MISSLSDRIASRLLKIITAITVKPVIYYRMTRDLGRSMLNCHTSVDPYWQHPDVVGRAAMPRRSLDM